MTMPPAHRRASPRFALRLGAALASPVASAFAAAPVPAVPTSLAATLVLAALVATAVAALSWWRLRHLQHETERLRQARDLAEARRQSSQRRLHELYDNVDLLVVAVDLRWRITYANTGFARLADCDRDALVGEDWVARFLPAGRATEREAASRALAAGTLARQTEADVLMGGGALRRVRWSTAPVRDDDGRVVGLLGVGQDVTEARSARRRADRVTGMYEALSRVNRAVVRGAAEVELCDEICAACVEAGHATLATLWRLRDDGLELVAHRGPLDAVFDPVRSPWPHRDPAFASSCTVQALESGRIAYTNDYLGDPRSRPWEEMARRSGMRALAAVPLAHQGPAIGVLLLHVSETDWFNPPLLSLFEAMAADVSYALAKLRAEREHEQARRRALEHERRFRRVFDAAPQMKTLSNGAQGRLLDVNQAFAEALGMAREQLVGRTLSEIGLGPSASLLRRLERELEQAGGRARGVEGGLVRGDGTTLDVLVNAEPLDFGEGQALLAVYTDVTELKRVERELRTSLERFELAASTGNVWAWDVREKLLTPPAAVWKRLGYADANGPAGWLALIHDDDREQVRRELIAHLKGLRPFDVEFRVRSADGREQWLHALGRAQRGADGRAIQMAGTVFDVSRRLDAERALRSREQQLAGIVDTTADAIVSVDAEHRIRVFNRAAAQMFRIEIDAALGQPLSRFIPEAAHAVHAVHLARYARAGAPSRRMGAQQSLTALRADGEAFPIEASVSHSGEGPALLLTAVVRDMSEARAVEQARRAQAVAEAANAAKTEFLSHMSHELRTPLNAVLGLLRLAIDDAHEPLAPAQRRRTELGEQAGRHLLGLIDDLLDFSRLEVGQVAVAATTVELEPVIEDAVAFVDADARRYGVRIVCESAEAARPNAWADPRRLRQVLVNLLSNGAKYNRPGGTVRVGVRRQADAVGIEVVDDGLGMDAAQLAQLFQPFNRLGREHGRVEGCGIGLALSRQLVERMDGRIEVSSEAGQGTRFVVWLPCAGAAAPAAASALAETPDAQTTGTVLYVEDEPVNRLVMEQFFVRWPGVRLLLAPDGARALALVREGRPDLVLLDMHLPDTTGVELAATLRGMADAQGLSIVMLSATASDDDRARAAAAGADDYWTKPWNFEAMATMIEHRLRCAKAVELVSDGRAGVYGP
jgi:PAS domain S-box-containing protein